MHVHLMYKDRNFDPDSADSADSENLIKDLEIDTLLEAMAKGDPVVYKTAKAAVLSGMNNPEGIIFRQKILKDCLNNREAVNAVYKTAGNAVEDERKVYPGLSSRSPDIVLSRSVKLIELYFVRLKELKSAAEKFSGNFVSKGFSSFFRMLEKELTPEYLNEIKKHLKILKFKKGVSLNAGIGPSNSMADYSLLPVETSRTASLSLFLKKNIPVFTYTISERDESGMRSLAAIRDRGIFECAGILASSAENIRKFFIALHNELAFYIGCMNLHSLLKKINAPVSFPVPLNQGDSYTSFSNLYDISLAIKLGKRITENSRTSIKENLIIITGANRGGKTTFIRSIGLAHLMMQSGMFTSSSFFSSPVHDKILTHFKREEDTGMNNGKLDEELERMNHIIDNITSESLLLLNESFSATNEKEGSELADQIVQALLKNKIKTYYVTHLYSFAHDLYMSKNSDVLFLRANRHKEDDGRQFLITKGEPLITSYAEDIYDSIFCS